jgi:hypothetical protein
MKSRTERTRKSNYIVKNIYITFSVFFYVKHNPRIYTYTKEKKEEKVEGDRSTRNIKNPMKRTKAKEIQTQTNMSKKSSQHQHREDM